MGSIFWTWRRVSDAFTASDLLDYLDVKTYIVALCAAVAGLFGMTGFAAYSDWSAPAVMLAGLAAAVLLALLVLAVRLVWVSFFIQSKRGNGGTQQQASASGEAKAPPEMPSLVSLFANDFEKSGKLTVTWFGFFETDFKDGVNLRIPYQVVEDHSAISKFVAFYIPETPKTYEVAEVAAAHYPNLFKQPLQATTGNAHSTNLVSSDQVVFTGRIFIYHETHLSLSQLAALEQIFTKNSARVEFRSTPYALSVFGSIDAGRTKPPPKFELRDGIPMPVQL